MADSVLDIVQRLSFEVKGDKDLQGVLNSFRQQAKEIDNLNKKLTGYKQALGNAMQPEAVANATAKIAALNKQIDLQNQLLQRRFANSKIVQDAIKAETTAITEQGSAAVKSNGVISQILGFSGGAGGVGRQLLTGSLIGLGIGSGLGLVTRAVSGLIEYAQAELDATGKAKKLTEANEGLAKSFDDLASSVEKYIADSIYLNSSGGDFDRTLDAAKRKAEAIKAIGVVNGQIFISEKNNLEADNSVREKELELLTDKKNALISVNEVLAKSSEKANAFISDPNVIANSANKDPQKNKNVQFDLFNQLSRQINTSAIPDEIKKTTILQLNEAYDKGANLITVLNKETRSYDLSLAHLKEEIENNTAATKSANAAFDSKHAAEIFQLNRSLYNKLIDENYAYNEKVLAATVESEDRIIKQVELQRSLSQQQLQREIQIAKDKGEYTFKIQSDYAKLSIQIDKDAEQKRLQNLEDFYQKQAKASDDVNKAFQQAQQQRATNKKSKGVSDESFSLQDFINEADEINIAVTSSFAEAQEKIRQEALLDGSDMTKVDAELASQQEALTAKSNDVKLKAWMDYYSALISLISVQSKRIIDEISLATDTEINKLSERLSKGLSLQRFGVLSNRISLQGSIDEGRSSILNKNKEIYAKQNELAAPNLSEADVTRLTSELNSLKDQLAKLETKLNVDQAALNASYRKDIADRIGLLQDLVSAAQSAYAEIASAQEKQLDREISVRTQRVDAAQKLAERGNTEALAQEQKKLDAVEKQRRDAALREEEINAALVVSNALLAVAKAAAEGGAGAFITIAATIAALGIGFAEAEKLSQASKSSFAKGVVGYNGKGSGTSDENQVWISNGESVITAEGTKRYAPLLKAINAGDALPRLAPIPAHYTHVSSSITDGISKADFKALGDRVDRVADAVNGIHIKAVQKWDKHGLHMMVEESRKQQKVNFG